MSGARWRAAVAAAASAGLVAACAASSAAASTGADASAAVTRSRIERAQVIDARGTADVTRVYSLCGRREAAHGIHCYTPKVLRTAYGVGPLLARKVDGRGETIVLPEETFSRADVRRLRPHAGLYLRESLRAYDELFGLGAARLRFDARLAPGVPVDRVATPEEILDVEMAHAMAPDASIVVQLVSGNLAKELPVIVSHGAREGQVMSISYGASESCVKPHLSAIQAALTTAQSRGVSVFASAGDQLDMSVTCTGATNGVRSVTMPASDPLVTAVGGTQLSVDPSTGADAGETVWNQQEAAGGKGMPAGTGGGFSTLFATPSYQLGVPGIGVQRGVPDVAFSASQTDGVAVAQYIEGPICATRKHVSTAVAEKLRCVLLQGVGGTSVGSPAWAGIGALADQYAHRSLGLLNPAIYRIGESAEYAQAFHDVTAGNNSARFKGTAISGYTAAAGWDPVTGWGSPNAQVLVPLLAQGG